MVSALNKAFSSLKHLKKSVTSFLFASIERDTQKKTFAVGDFIINV